MWQPAPFNKFKIMTREDFEFFEKNKLEDKGYSYCRLAYYDDNRRIYFLSNNDRLIENVKTGELEFRDMTEEERKLFSKHTDDALDLVIDYTIEKGYAEADEGFVPLGHISGGKFLWYVAKLNKETGKAEGEEFLVTTNTLPCEMHYASEEDLDEFDQALDYYDTTAHECAEEDEGIDHIELGSVLDMKYKIYPDKFMKDKDGKDIKVCYMFLEDDKLYLVGGLDVEDMEGDMQDPMSLACRDALLKRIEAYRAKQEEEEEE